MGLILKKGKTYTDRYGHTGSEFYAKVGRISDVNRSNQEVLFNVEIYLNKAASDRALFAVNTLSYLMKGEDFYTWYSKPLAEIRGIDPYKQLYLYLKTITDPETGNPIWEDWESDEQMNNSEH